MNTCSKCSDRLSRMKNVVKLRYSQKIAAWNRVCQPSNNRRLLSAQYEQKAYKFETAVEALISLFCDIKNKHDNNYIH